MNLAFGGPDNARLFITESERSSILQADLSVALADCSFASRSPLAAPAVFAVFCSETSAEPIIAKLEI
jgi:hypothetical protein